MDGDFFSKTQNTLVWTYERIYRVCGGIRKHASEKTGVTQKFRA